MPSEDYIENRAWSDQFIPQIKQIVGPFLLEESSFEVDTQQAADLVVMQGRNLTIACRVRRPGYFDKYPYDFTIRSRNNGHSTELRKIVSGWGDLMFYGHATATGRICAWYLIDLNAFRAHMIRNGFKNYIRFGETPNGDGTWFYWFDVRSFTGQPILIIARDGIPECDEILYSPLAQEAS